jgi:dTDP-4-dehydrorhamnose 3,5-epimerase
MKFTETSLSGVFLLEPDVFKDQRGYFMETYHHEKYVSGGIDRIFVQDNHSYSIKGTLRGLHYQFPHTQGKLVLALSGEIYDVAVDIRNGSPTFGQWIGVYLSSGNRHQIYIPEGFAHGFCVTSESASVLYKCTDFYYPQCDQGVLWSDPRLGIDWPVKEPLLSPKDANLPVLGEGIITKK